MEKAAEIMTEDYRNDKELTAFCALDGEDFHETLLKKPFDYTKWRREFFRNYDSDQFLKDAVEFDKNNPVQ